MAMEILEGVGFAVLYDNTTGIVFGPKFAGAWEVEELVEWLVENGHLEQGDTDLRQMGSEPIMDWLSEMTEEVNA